MATATAHGTCTGGSGPDLAAYPSLTHAPDQWGDFVACASNGTHVNTVAAALAAEPAGITTEDLAAKLGLSPGEVADALAYHAANA